VHSKTTSKRSPVTETPVDEAKEFARRARELTKREAAVEAAAAAVAAAKKKLEREEERLKRRADAVQGDLQRFEQLRKEIDEVETRRAKQQAEFDATRRKFEEQLAEVERETAEKRQRYEQELAQLAAEVDVARAQAEL